MLFGVHFVAALRVEQKTVVGSIDFDRRITLPPIDRNNALGINGQEGSMGYDKSTDLAYFNNGIAWIPIDGGASEVPAKSFSLFKAGDQLVQPFVPTSLGLMSTIPAPPYHDETGRWDLSDCIYTASENVILNINVDISWQNGISNLGTRFLRIIYKTQNEPPLTIKEASRQADPDLTIKTAQSVSTRIKMSPGDTASIEIFHNAPVPLFISGGNWTTVCGSTETY